MKIKPHVWMCGLVRRQWLLHPVRIFLGGRPENLLESSEYYTTENQIKAAVDGNL